MKAHPSLTRRASRARAPITPAHTMARPPIAAEEPAHPRPARTPPQAAPAPTRRLSPRTGLLNQTPVPLPWPSNVSHIAVLPALAAERRPTNSRAAAMVVAVGAAPVSATPRSRRGLAEDHQRPSPATVRQFTKWRVQTDPREPAPPTRARRRSNRDPNRGRAAARAR